MRIKHVWKQSITTQICVTIVALITGTVLLCWFLNTTFLDDYYRVMKVSQLTEGYYLINRNESGEENTKGHYGVELERLCANGNIDVLIISSDGTVVRSSANDNGYLIKQFMDVLFGGKDDESRRIVRATESYSIQQANDSRMGSDYLVLWGTLDNGNLVMMRTALEGIRESVVIANRFLGYIGMCAVLLCTVIAIFLTRRITLPIRQLTHISKKMTELDFTAKYVAPSLDRNEIDLLGLHMNQMSQTLERVISELKTANNQLQSDIKEKEEIDQMRKEFLSNVSHELKTPLALIQGYAEGLKECINDDEQSRDFYCEVIMDEAGKMNQMVHKLLTLNQLEFGNNPATMGRFDITELIYGVVQNSMLLLQQNGIEIKIENLAPTDVWADAFLIEAVVTNYLSNAIHYAAGEKKIRIFYENRGERLRVSVFNTGDCIPESEHEKIWLKFYKVDKARTRAYGGSGIGLSVVRAIMGLHHQSCGVINHPDGVEFWFELDKNSVALDAKEC